MDHHIEELVANLPHVNFAMYSARDINVEIIAAISHCSCQKILISMTDTQKEIFIQLLWSPVLSFLSQNVKDVQFGHPPKT